MKLTIGMASYNNPEQVWWTVQALRLYHDLSDCEILIIDNFGSEALEEWCKGWVSGDVRYIKWTEKRGTALPRDQVFKQAQGEFVLCIDSHVMLAPGSIEKLKIWIDENRDCPDLIHGSMMYDSLEKMGFVCCMNPVWEAGFYGTWEKPRAEMPTEPFEIPMHGLGLFGCFKNKWLGFNENFVGFGGEEGYIHQKYRNAGKRVLCLPFLVWIHRFNDKITAIPHPMTHEEKIRNYALGWREVGLDFDAMAKAFPAYKIENDYKIRIK